MIKAAMAATSVVAASLCLALPASAQSFPNKPVKIITPFAAGQGPDALLRLLADKLSAEWKQPVLVENKPGASGFIAFQAAKAAPGDGYTLVQLDSFHVGTQPHLFAKLPYDAFKDFEPITTLTRNYFFVTVAANSRLTSMADLIKAAQAKPEALSYGSWAVASPGHLGGLMLESETGTKMTHIPFKEASMLYTAVANGEVDWALGTGASTAPLEKAGKIKYLAVAAPKRLPGFENVVTATEAGGPKNYQVGGWLGLLAVKGTPKDVVDRINDAVTRAMASPEIDGRMQQFTYERYTMKPAEMAALMASEVPKWSRLIKNASIKLD